MKIQFVEVAKGRVQASEKIQGKVAFPDRRGPQPKEGEWWEVEVAGENPRKTVVFLLCIRQIKPPVRYEVADRWKSRLLAAFLPNGTEAVEGQDYNSWTGPTRGQFRDTWTSGGVETELPCWFLVNRLNEAGTRSIQVLVGLNVRDGPPVEVWVGNPVEVPGQVIEAVRRLKAVEKDLNAVVDRWRDKVSAKTPHLELVVGSIHSVQDLARMRLVLVIKARRRDSEISVWSALEESTDLECLEQALDKFLTDEEQWISTRAALKPELDKICSRAAALPSYAAAQISVARTEEEAAQGGNSLELYPIARWIVIKGRVWRGEGECYHGWYPLSRPGIKALDQFVRTEVEAPSHELRDLYRQSPAALRIAEQREEMPAIPAGCRGTFRDWGVPQWCPFQPGWTRITKKFFFGDEEITEEAYTWLLATKEPGA